MNDLIHKDGFLYRRIGMKDGLPAGVREMVKVHVDTYERLMGKQTHCAAFYWDIITCGYLIDAGKFMRAKLHLEAVIERVRRNEYETHDARSAAPDLHESLHFGTGRAIDKANFYLKRHGVGSAYRMFENLCAMFVAMVDDRWKAARRIATDLNRFFADADVPVQQLRDKKKARRT
jgi:hypothetical protein